MHINFLLAANKDVTNSESDVEVELSYKCKMCQPKAIFHRLDTFKRHLKNKNIHPDLSEADVAGEIAQLLYKMQRSALQVAFYAPPEVFYSRRRKHFIRAAGSILFAPSEALYAPPEAFDTPPEAFYSRRRKHFKNGSILRALTSQDWPGSTSDTNNLYKN